MSVSCSTGILSGSSREAAGPGGGGDQTSDQDRTPGNREFKACKLCLGLVERIGIAIGFPCDLVLADFEILTNQLSVAQVQTGSLASSLASADKGAHELRHFPFNCR